MKKTDKNKIKEFIRVDHAGERGAIKIYEGQLLALNTFVKDDDLKKKIEEMKVHEKEHCDYFENEIDSSKLREHLDQCEKCSQVVTEMAKVDVLFSNKKVALNNG